MAQPNASQGERGRGCEATGAEDHLVQHTEGARDVNAMLVDSATRAAQ